MNTAQIIILIGVIILILLIIKWLKPYLIKHDTTILFTGGLGAGKTLEAVKTSIVLIRKQRFYKYTMYNLLNVKLRNFFAKLINKKRLDKKLYKTYLITLKQTKKDLKKLNKNSYKFYNEHLKDYHFKKTPIKMRYKRPKPMLYSNIPIHYKTHAWSKKREWSETLFPKHVLLLKKITEYSVVLIDEFPQFINQFEWKNEIVQTNANEWITFFRHYIGGYAVLTAQSESDIVVQIRRKLNQAIWCYDFKKWCFGLFYTNRMCDIMLSDNISTITTSQIEENTKLHFGLFPPRKTYDTRCYSIRYENILEKANPRENYNNIKTMRVLRLNYYISPLDLKTTYAEKMNQLEQAKKLEQPERNVAC